MRHTLAPQWCKGTLNPVQPYDNVDLLDILMCNHEGAGNLANSPGMTYLEARRFTVQQAPDELERLKPSMNISHPGHNSPVQWHCSHSAPIECCSAACGLEHHAMQLPGSSTPTGPSIRHSKESTARCRALQVKVNKPRKMALLGQQVVDMGQGGEAPHTPEEGLVSMLHVSPHSLSSGQFRQQVSHLGRQGSPCVNVCLQGSLAGEGAGDSPTPELVRALGVLYDELSLISPRILAVPLLKLAGWHDESIKAKFSGLPTLVLPHEDAHQAQLPAPGASAGQEHILLPQLIPAEQSHTSVSPADSGGAGAPQPLLFDHVAVGGTFDRLHCGHELLLATTALVASRTVYIGITADLLLVNKNHKELLQPYEQRRDAAVQFMQAVRPDLHIQAGALCDPQEPTQAELDPCMQALVVSQETLPGAVKINQGRVARGLTPLFILVVPVIGTNAQSGQKLSSTQLRAQDAARALSAQPTPA